MNILRLVIILVFLLTFLSSCCFYNKTETEITSILCCGRDFSKWSQKVTIFENITTETVQKHSSDYYFSLGHMGGFGGGNHFYVLEFNYKNFDYKWTAQKREKPVIIKFFKNHFYIATLDTTNINKIDFKFYKAPLEGHFTEIKSQEFPISVAIQNSWINKKNKRKKQLIHKFNPNNSWFRNSITVKIWHKILEPHKFNYRSNIDKKFVEAAILKYFPSKYNKN